MVKNGHDVTVFTSHVDKTKNFEKYDRIKIYRFGKDREQFLLKVIIHLFKSKESYDLIHTSTYSAMIPAYVFSYIRKIPKILNVHEVWSLKEWTEFTNGRGLFYFLEERMLFSLPFDYYISPSEHTKNDLIKIGIPAERIKVIPHGIDNKLFNPKIKKFRKSVRKLYGLNENEIVACFVGKPTIFKGINYILNAIQKAVRETNIKFLFLLSRAYKYEYEKLMERIGRYESLRKNVFLIEPTKEHNFVAKIIGASDFLIMPSLTEGFGFAVAEAASIGIPTIVTKDTSLTEVVENKKISLYVNVRDSNDLTKAIIKLAENKKFRERLSVGKKFASWDKVVKEYEKIYEDVISKHKED